MNIIYLHTEPMGYTLATIKELTKLGAKVHLIMRDKNKISPYIPPKMKNVFFYKRSNQTRSSIIQLANKIKPNLVVVSGWVDKTYLCVARYLKKKGCKVVCGLDGQWYSTPKQWLAYYLGKIGFFSFFFSHAWVAGVFQYEYAKKLSFTKDNIIFDLYSADLSIFSKNLKKNLNLKKKKYPHRFLFVGRFNQVKGIDNLLKAWELLGESKKDWELHLIGNGKLKIKKKQSQRIYVKKFLKSEDLLKESKYAGCFILPSTYEPWGVVVHEFAAAGLPLITSNVVGAANTFLINGLNGYKFRCNSTKDLLKCLKKIISKNENQLLEMGRISSLLARKITPFTSAKNLISIL